MAIGKEQTPKERIEKVIRKADEVLERWEELKEDLFWKLEALRFWGKRK